MSKLAKSLVALALLVCHLPQQAMAFSFSDEDAKEKAAEKKRAQAAKAAATPKMSQACTSDLKDKKVMVLLANRRASGLDADPEHFGPHFGSINGRLQRYGVRTYTPEQIKAQIAQAEIDAYFKNDVDGAIAASSKLGAQLILRGAVSSRSAINPVLRIPEVYISIGFALTRPDGKVLSEASAKSESYSNTDTYGMAATLVAEQAGGVVASLMNGYCRQFDGAAKR